MTVSTLFAGPKCCLPIISFATVRTIMASTLFHLLLYTTKHTREGIKVCKLLTGVGKNGHGGVSLRFEGVRLAWDILQTCLVITLQVPEL